MVDRTEVIPVQMPRDDEIARGELVNKRRRQKRSIETREKVIAAAVEEFAQCGFSGASTITIAQRAGIDHGLITHHFGSKEGLWTLILGGALQEMAQSLKTSLDRVVDRTDTVKLLAAQENFIRFISARPYIPAIMSHARLASGPALTSMTGPEVNWVTSTMVDLIAGTQARDQYEQGNPGHLHMLFIGAAARIHMMPIEVELLVGRSTMSRDFINDHVELCRRLFFRNLTAEDLQGLPPL